MSLEPLLQELEKLVHRHIKLVDATRRAAIKAKRSGDTTILDERAQKLLSVSKKLSKLLETLHGRASPSLERLLDEELRDRLELLLFFLSEVGLREELSLWDYVAKHRDSLKGSITIEIAEYMAKRSEELRGLALDLLEKVKSLERAA